MHGIAGSIWQLEDHTEVPFSRRPLHSLCDVQPRHAFCRRCVGEYYSSCMEKENTQFCTVVRSTNYASGVCLSADCPAGTCPSAAECTGTQKAMLDLVGSLDSTDTKVWLPLDATAAPCLWLTPRMGLGLLQRRGG